MKHLIGIKDRLLTTVVSDSTKEIMRLKKEIIVLKRINDNLSNYKSFYMHNRRQHIEIAARNEPSFLFSADYIDRFSINKNKLILVIADVSGHGIAASLVALMLKNYFTTLIGQEQTATASMLYKMNNDLQRTFKGSGIYNTLLVSVFDFNEKIITHFSGGHPPPLMFDVNSRKEKIVFSEQQIGPLFGIKINMQYHAVQSPLKDNQCLVYYTDGITDIRNESGLLYGEKHLKYFIKKNCHLKTKIFVNKIFAELEDYRDVRQLCDDRSIIVVKT